MARRGSRGGRRLLWAGALVLVAGVIAIAFGVPHSTTGFAAQAEPPAKPEPDTCFDCHRDPDFAVTNPKLYAYFNEWQASIHQQEGASCADCHGGDRTASSKEEAHGDGVGQADPDSGVHYKAISDTCGRCHQDILDGFKTSHHYRHIDPEGETTRRGPHCVTCHGAIDVEVLNFDFIEQACGTCHDADADGHPEYATRARRILSRLNSTQRFYRFISVRAEADEAKSFFEFVDPQLRQLSITWHTADLDKMDKELDHVIWVLKAKRGEILQRRAEQRRSTPIQ